MTKSRCIMMVALLAQLGACGASRGVGVPGGHKYAAGSREVLRAEELTGSYESVYEAITRLRPQFINIDPSHTGTSLPQLPVAYLDGVKLAELGMLRRIPTSWVAEVRFVRGITAAVRYRADHAAGAILVTTKKGL